MNLQKDLFFFAHQAIEPCFKSVTLLQNEVIRLSHQMTGEIPRVRLADPDWVAESDYDLPVLPFAEMVRHLNRATLYVESATNLLKPLLLMQHTEFESFRSSFGTASGLQSAHLRLIEIRFGLFESNLQRFDQQHPATKRLFASLSEAERNEVNHESAKMSNSKFADDCGAEFSDLLHQAFAEPNLRDIVYFVFFSSNQNKDKRRFLVACKRLDRFWRRWHLQHQKLANYFVGSAAGSAAPNGYLESKNLVEKNRDYRLYAFPILQNNNEV